MFDKMSDSDLLAAAWRVASVLPSVPPSEGVDAFVRHRRAELKAIGPDPRLAELHAKLETERAGLDARLEAQAKAIGEAAVAAELDGGDAKVSAALQRELNTLREARDSIGHRLAALDARIRADCERVARERHAKAAAVGDEIVRERKERRAAAIGRLREVLAWVAQLNADDNRLATSADAWRTSAAELAAEIVKGGAV